MSKKTKLPNGLTIVTNTIKSVQTVVAAVGIHTGSRNETEQEIGLSHALEHMLFKGTQKRTYEMLNEEVEGVGSYTNAFTSNEQTIYYIKGIKENFKMSLDVLSDQVLHSIFPEQEIKKEMEVIVQEIKRSNDNPNDVVYDNFMRIAFKKTPLENPILGSKEQVLSYTTEDMRNYWKKHYHPKNMILSVAGNMDHKTVVKLARKFFKIPPTPFKKQEVWPIKWNGGECLVHSDSQQQVNLMIGWNTKGYTADKKDLAAISLANCILGTGMGSMLSNEIREKRGLCYSVGSFTKFYAETGLLGVYGGTDGEKLGLFMETTAEVMRNFSKVVTEKDLIKAKNIFKTSVCTAEESIDNIAMKSITSLQNHNKTCDPENSLKIIDSIKLEDVKKAFNKLLKTNIVLSIYGNAPQLLDEKIEKSKKINLENFQNMIRGK